MARIFHCLTIRYGSLFFLTLLTVAAEAEESTIRYVVNDVSHGSDTNFRRRLHDYKSLDDTSGLLKEFHPQAYELVAEYHPVFDFDTDGCLPSALISRKGEGNGGLKPSGSITGQCRSHDFMRTSNTYHRWSRQSSGSSDDQYEVHMYDLYFEKDQVSPFGGGHRHDIETVLMYFKNKQPMEVGVSAHGHFELKSFKDVEKYQGNHPKVVYHKDNGLTHAFRFGKKDEKAENHEGWTLPPLASWNHLHGDGISNKRMRDKINNLQLGDASVKVKDISFFQQVNVNRPEGFPMFRKFQSTTDVFVDTQSPCCGPHGAYFDDFESIDNINRKKGTVFVREVAIRFGSRVDGVKLTMNDGTVLKHGGDGGTSKSLKLASGEYIYSVELWRGKKSSKSRVYGIRIKTSRGQELKGGTFTSDGPHMLPLPEFPGALIGFHGRADSEMFKIGGIWDTRVPTLIKTSVPCCGPHGASFDDYDTLMRMHGISRRTYVKKVEIRSGARVDSITVTMMDGTVFKHGGNGGSAKHLTLNRGEYISGVELWRGQKSGKSRVYGISVKTNHNREISGGSRTSDGPHSLPSPPTGGALIGFHGRADSEIFKLGGVWGPYKPAIGHLDVATTNVVRGWACDPDQPEKSIGVHIYFGRASNIKGAHTVIKTIANKSNEKEVSKVCGGGNSHRFSVTVTNEAKQALLNGDGKVYAYALDSMAHSYNPAISGSPKQVVTKSASCQDTNLRYCPIWQKKGYCKGVYARYLAANCKKSCNLC